LCSVREERLAICVLLFALSKEEVGEFLHCTGAKFVICLTAKDCFSRVTVNVYLKVRRSYVVRCVPYVVWCVPYAVWCVPYVVWCVPYVV
jgi:hypothetical protein